MSAPVPLTILHILLCVALGFTLTLLLALMRLLKRPPPPRPPSFPGIVVLRPLEGSEPGLCERLLSSATARYPGMRRVLLLVADEGNPAWPEAEQAARRMRDLGDIPVEVVVTGAGAAGNRKVAQLLAGLERSDEEIIVQADSDVVLEGDDLIEVVSALLASERHGAAFAPPVEIAPRTLADRASAALVGASAQSFLALFALSDLLGGVPSLAGALCCFRRSALLRVGGLAPLKGYLGEDYELSRRLIASGHTVALARCQARCTDGGRGLSEVIRRVARWMMVVRSQRTGLLPTYPLLLGAVPPFFLMGLLLGDRWLLTGTLLLIILRTALSMVLRRTQGLRGALPALADAVLAELLLWVALPSALLRRTFEWRGHRYRIGPGGALLGLKKDASRPQQS